MTLDRLYHLCFGATWAVHYCFVILVLGIPVLAILERLIKGSQGGRAWSFLRGPYPICISLAITTGIAPLLFSQVLFHRVFYQSFIVLHPLPLIGLGMLIVFFYVSYLVKYCDKLALPLAFVQVAFLIVFTLMFGLVFNATTKGTDGLRALWFAGEWPPLLWHSLVAHLIASSLVAALFLRLAQKSWLVKALPLLIAGIAVSIVREVLRIKFGGPDVVPPPIQQQLDISVVIFGLSVIAMIFALWKACRIAFPAPSSSTDTGVQ